MDTGITFHIVKRDKCILSVIQDKRHLSLLTDIAARFPGRSADALAKADRAGGNWMAKSTVVTTTTAVITNNIISIIIVTITGMGNEAITQLGGTKAFA